MSPIIYSRLWLLCAILLLTVWHPATVAAHEGDAPLRSFTVQAGPYPLTVHYYNEGRGGQELHFALEPDPSVNGALRFYAQAVPGATVEAVPVRATLLDDPTHPGLIEGRVALPVSGQWLLSIDVEGPEGPGDVNVPIIATPPPAIPEWVGWAIGLLPVAAAWAVLISQAQRAGLNSQPHGELSI